MTTVATSFCRPRAGHGGVRLERLGHELAAVADAEDRGWFNSAAGRAVLVHGKCSLINKMPGEYDDKFSNLRVFYGFMMGHPGKKLSFMGNEFAQFIEWNYAQQLDWLLLDYERHRQMQDYVRDLNHFYLDHSSLWNNDSDWNGFRWISADDRDNSVIAFRRIDRRGCELIVICNFCPVTRTDYRLGLPKPGEYEAVFNSDEVRYGGNTIQKLGLPVSTVQMIQGSILIFVAAGGMFTKYRIVRKERRLGND